MCVSAKRGKKRESVSSRPFARRIARRRRRGKGGRRRRLGDFLHAP